MIGNRLRQLRKSKKLMSKEMAKYLNITASTYSDYENNKARPSYEVLGKLAKFFNVTTDYLLGITDKLDDLEIIKVDKKRRVPLLGSVQAGEPIFSEENLLDEFDVPDLGLPEGDIFFLRVAGDSMNNKHIIDGSMILVEHTSSINPGEVGVIILNGDEATVKEFHKSNNIVTLMPDSSNDEFKPIVIDINKVPVNVVGRVLKVVIDVK